MEHNSSHSIIPQGELKCVWMDAGVTAFKLCNLQLRCESCEFNTSVLEKQKEDAEVQGSLKPGAQRAQTAETIFKTTLKKHLEGLRNAELPADRMYNRSNYWMQPAHDGDQRIGINHIMAKFFQPILSIVVSKAPINIRKHDPFAWIILPGGAITLRSPIDATIVRFNPALSQRPHLLSSSPFSDGWLMELHSKNKGTHGFAPVEESKSHLEKSIHTIEHSFGQAFRHHNPLAGTTMFDGGTSIESLEGVLGSQVYLEVVNRILHMP